MKYHEDYSQKIDNHYKELNKICKDAISNNGSMIEHIRALELKNKALQASLDKVVELLNEKENENAK